MVTEMHTKDPEQSNDVISVILNENNIDRFHLELSVFLKEISHVCSLYKV